MDRTSRIALVLFLFAVLVSAGCQSKVNMVASAELGPGDIKAYSIDAPIQQQQLVVEARSTNAPIDVYVVLADDEDVPIKRLEQNQQPEDLVRSSLQEKEAVFEVTIPAKRNFVVLLANAHKTTSVSLKVKSK